MPDATALPVMLTVPLPWHANGTANVRLERLSAIDPLPSRPGPVAPEGIAAAVPGATNAGAVPGGTGRSVPLPGGGPGGPGGAWADAAAGAASSARAAIRTVRLRNNSGSLIQSM